MSTLTHSLQNISGTDHDRRLRRSWRHCQHWRQNNHQSPLCRWHRWWLSRREELAKLVKRLNKASTAYGMEISAEKTNLMTNNTSGINTEIKKERTEAWDSHKLQVPGLSYNWWGFQAWDTLQYSTDNSSIDKVETSFEWLEHFFQFQDATGALMTDALPCHINLLVCSWIIDPHRTSPKKNTSHGNEVRPQDTTHLIRRPCYQWGSLCQIPAGNRTTRRPPDHRNETQTAVVWSCFTFIRSGQNHLARHSEMGKKTR